MKARGQLQIRPSDSLKGRWSEYNILCFSVETSFRDIRNAGRSEWLSRKLRKGKFIGGINLFVMTVRLLMMICATGDRELRQMTKTLNVCAMLRGATGEGVFTRYQRK
jgi:hypothetical protein